MSRSRTSSVDLSDQSSFELGGWDGETGAVPSPSMPDEFVLFANLDNAPEGPPMMCAASAAASTPAAPANEPATDDLQCLSPPVTPVIMSTVLSSVPVVPAVAVLPQQPAPDGCPRPLPPPALAVCAAAPGASRPVRAAVVVSQRAEPATGKRKRPHSSRVLLPPGWRRLAGENGRPGPFVCPSCGQKATSASNAIRHRQTHTRERLFRCPHCPYETNQHSNLQRHLRAKKRPCWELAGSCT